MMNKTLAFAGLAGAAMIASGAAADSASNNTQISWAAAATGVVYSQSIALPNLVSIDSIVVNIAHTWVGDLDMVVVGPGGTANLTLLGSAAGFGPSNNLGSGAANSFALTLPYTFAQAGTAWPSPSGTANISNVPVYAATSWIAGPQAAGNYTLTISDLAAGDGGFVNGWTINYTVPAPGALALMGLAGVVGGRRRRA
jgi:MYXO-CTERM domain-containing protein